MIFAQISFQFTYQICHIQYGDEFDVIVRRTRRRRLDAVATCMCLWVHLLEVWWAPVKQWDITSLTAWHVTDKVFDTLPVI